MRPEGSSGLHRLVRATKVPPSWERVETMTDAVPAQQLAVITDRGMLVQFRGMGPEVERATIS